MSGTARETRPALEPERPTIQRKEEQAAGHAPPAPARSKDTGQVSLDGAVQFLTGLTDAADQEEAPTPGDSCPSLAIDTRAGFAVEAYRAAHPVRSKAMKPDGILEAVQKLKIVKDRLEQPVTRAEAAMILMRALRLPSKLPEGKVAYFYDVQPSDWFFMPAHVTRLFGIFKSGGDNFFRGSDRLIAAHAEKVLKRAKAKKRVAVGEQAPGMENPPLEPDAGLGLLGKEELTAEEIAVVRKTIAALPEEAQGQLYAELSGKGSYRNQRNNEGEHVLADYMCNMTSLAMALEHLGVSQRDPNKQFEDELDERLYEHLRKGDNEARYGEAGQRAVAEDYGASVKRVQNDFKDAAGAKKMFTETVLPRLERGDAATMSIVTPDTPKGHIVRLQWVENGGVRVDDPFGSVVSTKSGYRYTLNARDLEEGEGVVGQDNLWTWDMLGVIGRGRYVQFVSVAG